jgi:DNA replicative helicase MCM subunit Mcm2 (Cdc46/Mcm family)
MASKILQKQEEPDLNLLPRAQLSGYLDQGRNLQPRMSNEALRILTRYFDYLKTTGTCQRNLTTRQIESLIRVSEAHAKLCHRTKVNKFDAVSTILLLESSCLYNSSTSIDLNLCFADVEMFDDMAA